MFIYFPTSQIAFFFFFKQFSLAFSADCSQPQKEDFTVALFTFSSPSVVRELSLVWKFTCQIHILCGMKLLPETQLRKQEGEISGKLSGKAYQLQHGEVHGLHINLAWLFPNDFKGWFFLMGRGSRLLLYMTVEHLAIQHRVVLVTSRLMWLSLPWDLLAKVMSTFCIIIVNKSLFKKQLHDFYDFQYLK